MRASGTMRLTSSWASRSESPPTVQFTRTTFYRDKARAMDVLSTPKTIRCTPETFPSARDAAWALWVLRRALSMLAPGKKI